MRIIHLEETTSTNDYVKKQREKLETPSLVQADYQTEGRGRRGRTWNSERGKNFLATIFFKDDPGPFHSLVLASLTILETLRHFGVHAHVKLPNDIVTERGKIAGILVERLAGREPATAIGIGLNVNEVFQDSTRVSIRTETSAKHDVARVRDILADRFERLWREPFQQLFKTFKKRIDPGSLIGRHQGRRVFVEDVDEDFLCVIEGEKIPCQEIEFSLKESN